MEPRIRLCAGCGTCLGFSLSLFLCPSQPCSCTFSLFLKKENFSIKVKSYFIKTYLYAHFRPSGLLPWETSLRGIPMGALGTREPLLGHQSSSRRPGWAPSKPRSLWGSFQVGPRPVLASERCAASVPDIPTTAYQVLLARNLNTPLSSLRPCPKGWVQV